MLQSFLESWDLFHLTYLAGWLIAVLLSLVGVQVVARDQIFIGAAVSQASTLGIALAMGFVSLEPLVGVGWVHADAFPAVTAVVFSVLAALLTARGGGHGRESHESITGWVFLLSASGSILVVSHSPHGLEEVHRLVASTIIGATEGDILIFGALVVLTVAGIAAALRPLLLITLDPVTALALGLRVRTWSAVTSTWLGLVVGLAIHSSGMLYTFGLLVLPALVAKNLCREVRMMFLAAPVIALLSTVAAFIAANHYDYPPAQMAVALLCLLLVLAWAGRFLRERLAGAR